MLEFHPSFSFLYCKLHKLRFSIRTFFPVRISDMMLRATFAPLQLAKVAILFFTVLFTESSADGSDESCNDSPIKLTRTLNDWIGHVVDPELAHLDEKMNEESLKKGLTLDGSALSTYDRILRHAKRSCYFDSAAKATEGFMHAIDSEQHRR